MPKSREPSPFGQGYDREGNLKGAAKMAHEAKMEREGKQPQHEYRGDETAEQHGGNGGHGQGYDRHGNLVGAAKMMHEMKEKREHGEMP